MIFLWLGFETWYLIKATLQVPNGLDLDFEEDMPNILINNPCMEAQSPYKLQLYSDPCGARSSVRPAGCSRSCVFATPSPPRSLWSWPLAWLFLGSQRKNKDDEGLSAHCSRTSNRKASSRQVPEFRVPPRRGFQKYLLLSIRQLTWCFRLLVAWRELEPAGVVLHTGLPYMLIDESRQQPGSSSLGDWD